MKLDPKDIRIDTYRPAVSGGMQCDNFYCHMKIFHLPTNTVVEGETTPSQKSTIKLRERLLAELEEKLAG